MNLRAHLPAGRTSPASRQRISPTSLGPPRPSLQRRRRPRRLFDGRAARPGAPLARGRGGRPSTTLIPARDRTPQRERGPFPPSHEIRPAQVGPGRDVGGPVSERHYRMYFSTFRWRPSRAGLWTSSRRALGPARELPNADSFDRNRGAQPSRTTRSSENTRPLGTPSTATVHGMILAAGRPSRPSAGH